MYSLAQNQAGHALAILRDGYYVLHLAAGTVRNEKYAQRVVDVLNAAEQLHNCPTYEGACNELAQLDQAVKRLRGDL